MEQEASSEEAKLQTATLGGGCFWCLEAVFDGLRGVDRVESGYAGGHVADPTYHQVCAGNTGHAEVVRVTFDPQVLSYREVLEVFFAIHDPTTKDRQGNDVGSQYRSVIYHHSPEQQETARQIIAELAAERVFARPIVTELAPAGVFHEAEGYHQEYFRNNADQPYCQVVVAPKLAKFREKFAAKAKQ
ncbi:MAG TPA: peptide-methionine (S)-S-oxide reductase MsrA [Acidiferrobacterales bacterium]|nr:peptide-methionine (S)-S-oxide reductase MsrA [Acidiferrobacterales bacterium]